MSYKIIEELETEFAALRAKVREAENAGDYKLMSGNVERARGVRVAINAVYRVSDEIERCDSCGTGLDKEVADCGAYGGLCRGCYDDGVVKESESVYW